MTKLRRILCAVMAVALAVAILVPMTVSAAVPKDKLDAMGFVAYRVLDRDPDTIPVDDAEDNNKVYTVNDDFDEFFENITPEAYEAGIHGSNIWLTVGDDGNLMLVPSTTTTRPANVIVLPVNADVTANSAEVLAGVLLSEIESGSAKASGAQRLAGWLKAYAEAKKAAGNWPNHQDEVTVEANSDGQIDIGDLEYGYWLVYATNTVDGVSSVKVVLEVGEKSQSTINVKAEYDGLDKKVRNLTDKDNTFEEIAQADASDILEYEVKFDIQPLHDYQSNNNRDITDLKYIIRDTLTNQRLVNYIDTTTTVHGASPYMGAFLLEFEINGRKIYYADVESEYINDSLKSDFGLKATDTLRALVGIRKDVGGIDYGEYEDGKQQFHITFEWNALQTLLGEYGAKVTLKYKAELTSDAVLKNPNKVELEYSNDPTDHTKWTTNEDTTTVYSYGLDVTKTFDGETATADLWASVVFNLYEASLPAGGTAPTALVEGKKIAFIEKVAGTAGDYQRADSLDNATSSYDLKLKTTENTLNVYGLDPGYYVLEETSSPNGYLLGGKVYIYIDEYGNVLRANNSKLWLGDKDISEGGITGTELTDDKDSLQIKIDNQKRDFELPETGAMGVWLFGIGGVLLLAAAAFVYSAAKKRSKNN